MSDCLMTYASSWALYTGLTVTSTTPILAVANANVSQSGTLRAQMPRLSPRLMPIASRPLASWSTRSSNSA